MWFVCPVRDLIAGELRHMHRPEIAEIALNARFAINGRILFIDPAPSIPAELCGQLGQAFLENWIGIAAMRAGVPIDEAVVFLRGDYAASRLEHPIRPRLDERPPDMTAQLERGPHA